MQRNLFLCVELDNTDILDKVIGVALLILIKIY